MKYYVVIPAHNEEAYIADTLQSLADQSLPPAKAIVVNDHSTDRTEEIARSFTKDIPWLEVISISSGTEHLPGSKVIRAFHKGLKLLDDDYDVVVKLDADLILPNNYFETTIRHFQSDPLVGMAGGFAYIEQNGNWVLENLTDKDHIRGAFKAYRKRCFEQIGGLKPAMGWDTVDELLCRYYGWKILTDPSLKVKHLKPTGAQYNSASRYRQGTAFYRLGYGGLLTFIASLKLALKKKKPWLLFDYLKGYRMAAKRQDPWLVDTEQAAFIRSYRWRKIKRKVFG